MLGVAMTLVAGYCKGETWAFADFGGVDTPTTADFKLQRDITQQSREEMPHSAL